MTVIQGADHCRVAQDRDRPPRPGEGRGGIGGNEPGLLCPDLSGTDKDVGRAASAFPASPRSPPCCRQRHRGRTPRQTVGRRSSATYCRSRWNGRRRPRRRAKVLALRRSDGPARRVALQCDRCEQGVRGGVIGRQLGLLCPDAIRPEEHIRRALVDVPLASRSSRADHGRVAGSPIATEVPNRSFAAASGP